MTHSGLEVLVIDDDATIGHFLERWINRCGFRARVVQDLVAARASLEGQDIGLVICDFHLAGGNGQELALWLRGQGRSTPFVLFSGEFDPETEFDAAEYPGCDALLSKPCEMAELQRLLRRFLPHRPSTAELAAVRP